MRVLIIPIGEIESLILKDIASVLEKTFHFEVKLTGGISIPVDSYNQRRNQYHSTTILRRLQSIKKDFDRVLGVIDVDLYVPELNFVFGEADIFSGIAIISLIRLRQEFYGLPQDRGLFHLRAIKEAIHEIGHTCGLSHCPDPRCIMHFSNSLSDTDIKGPDFCNICKNRLML